MMSAAAKPAARSQLADSAQQIPAPRAEQAPAESTTILAVIQRAAADPSCNIEKMERLMQMHERFMDRSASEAFNAAMVRAQNLMGAVARNAYNEQTKSYYARLEDIDRAISPIFTGEGFSLSFGTEDSPMAGFVRVVCDVMHAAGHTRRFRVDLPLDAAGIAGKANKTGVHAHGSTYSYARRYLTLMIFNVVMGGDDDDGQAAVAQRVKTITAPMLVRLRSVLEKCGPTAQARFNENWPNPEAMPLELYDNEMVSLQSAADKYQKRLASAQGAQQ